MCKRVWYTYVCICMSMGECSSESTLRTFIHICITHNCVANIRFIYINIFLCVRILSLTSIFTSHSCWYIAFHGIMSNAKKKQKLEVNGLFTGSRILGFTYALPTLFSTNFYGEPHSDIHTYTHTHTHTVTSNEVLISSYSQRWNFLFSLYIVKNNNVTHSIQIPTDGIFHINLFFFPRKFRDFFS